MDDFELLKKEALADPEVRCAYKENALRRMLAGSFEVARAEHGLTVRKLAKVIGTSASQVQRLLHHEVGGSLTLSTIVRAADALGLTVRLSARPEPRGPALIIPFGASAWTPAIAASVREPAPPANRPKRLVRTDRSAEWTQREPARPSCPPFGDACATGG